jgi:hypothetical protein
LQAQASYSFCTQDADTPPQELTDAIAKFLDANYQGGVEWVKPVCHGPNPLMNNQETWVYQAEFGGGGTALDIAVIEGANSRQISVQDTRESGRDANGWTEWKPLD